MISIHSYTSLLLGYLKKMCTEIILIVSFENLKEEKINNSRGLSCINKFTYQPEKKSTALFAASMSAGVSVNGTYQSASTVMPITPLCVFCKSKP